MSPLLLCKQLLRERHVEVGEIPIGLGFRYQGGNFLVVNNEEDQQYLQLVMPNIYEVTNTMGRQMCLEALNKVNGSLKVGKAVLRSDGEVWLFTEIFLDSSPELDDFFFRLLDILFEMRRRFYTILKE